MEVAELKTGQIQEYDNCQASLPSLVCAFDPPRTRPMAQIKDWLQRLFIYLFIIHLFIYLSIYHWFICTFTLQVFSFIHLFIYQW